MYTLLALDLDDTLLGKDATIGAAEKAALEDARARGIAVTLVTARSWRATRRYVDELGLTAPVICMTGAAVYTPDGRPLWHYPLPMKEARRIARQADDEAWSLRLYYADGRILHSCPADDFFPHAPAHAFPAPSYDGPLSSRLESGEEPLQAVLLGNRSVEGALALLPDMPDLIASTYDRHSPTSRTHIFYRHVSKGAALARYCAEFGYQRESVIAMGDGEPDRSMIEWAGTGVAMGWAPEGVRQAANLVTAADDPHPVATVLQQLLGTY